MDKSNSQGGKFGKRVYIVNRDFQFRYIYLAVVVGVISTAITASVILMPLYQFEILRIPKFLPAPILWSMVGAVCLNILFIGLVGVFVTHKIAGPIYALVRSLRALEEGKLVDEVRVREGDDLKYLVRSFNGMVSSLRSRAEKEASIVEKIWLDIEASNGLPSEEMKESLGELRNFYRFRLDKSRDAG